jgi:glycosidase
VRSSLPALLLALAACVAPRPGAPPSAATGREASALDDWARGAVFYEVFVRSFADSDGDGVGDLRGLEARLDYLNDGDPGRGDDLGVDALWLMPICESPSYHGYDVVDYRRVDREYGSEEDFDGFLAAAHRRGVRVIIDLVLNHTSAEHPWFVDAASSPGSPRRDWYLWRPDDPGWTQPWGGDRRTWHERGGAFYYGVFWRGMPDLNYSHPPVREEMQRVAAHWLRRGVDGFRLDATRHLFAGGPGAAQNDQPETHVYLADFSAAVRSVRPDALLVGENWTDTASIAPYFRELPANFNFPLAEAIVRGVESGSASQVAAVLRDMAALYPESALDAPFLTNHDQTRLSTQLGGDPAKLRLAAAVLLTLPGAPFLYYGEEIGLQNGPGREDEHKRTPLPWDASPGAGFSTGKPWFELAPGHETAHVAAERGRPGSLFERYRTLIALRHGSPALRLGSLELLAPAAAEPGAVLAFLRRAPGSTALVAHNYAGAASTAGPFDLQALRLEELWLDPGAAAVRDPSRGWTLTLPAHSSAAWSLR